MPLTNNIAPAIHTDGGLIDDCNDAFAGRTSSDASGYLTEGFQGSMCVRR